MTTRQPLRPKPMMTPGQVAALFSVEPRTVTRWANEGRLSAIRTLGGHRRYRRDEVEALYNGTPWPPAGGAE